MATAIFFNGRRLNVPQAVSKIDASALAAVSPAAVGTIALVGTAEGGAPQTVDESLADANQPGTVQERYRSGDLRTAGIFAFEPSADVAIPGGAQKEILVKVNTATQGGTTLPDDNTTDSLDITSKDWGLFNNQINIDVAAGTANGKKYTVTFEGTVEVFDDVGGTDEGLFDLIYAPGAAGYDTALATINAASFTVLATKAETGLDAERANDIAAPGVVDVVSSAGGDTTQTITIYGLDAGGDLITEIISLNGTTNVQGLTSFTKVLACRLSAAAVGTVTVSDFPVVITLFTLAPATIIRGLLDTTNTPAAGAATVSIDVDTAVDVVLIGTDSAGAPVNEVFDMTTGNTTPVVGTSVFANIDTILLGDVAAGRTITASINSVQTLHSTFTTVGKVVDRLNTLAGYTANTIVTNFTTFLMTDADYHVASARPPITLLATATFFADLFFGAKILTEQSAFVNAARATGGGLPPADTTATVYLTGGGEGATTITEWTSAFKLLDKRRYNILVPLTHDPAIHNLALTHLIAKAGRLKSECNGYVGIGVIGASSGETRANIQAQIQALNTRHISAISQEVERFNPLTGAKTFYPPYIAAAIAAGMQAGSAIAEPLTRKLMIATDLRNDVSWDVDDDKTDLIDRGLMIAEKVDGVGIRWIRSITTHLADDNLAFVEMSSNESLITFVFEFRNALEQKIGQRGLGGTVGAIKALARDVANRIRDEEKIVAHRALQVEQVGDVFPVSIEVALVNPINFIPITVHLTPTVALAA